MNDEETYFWDSLAQEARSKSLDKLHANAANWAKALTALLGVLALVGLTLSPTAWAGQTLPLWRGDATTAAPGLLLALFAALLGATWYAHAGSQAKEQLVRFDPEGYRAYYLKASKDAYTHLQSFRLMLLLAALPFVLYAVIGLLARPVDTATTQFEVVTDQGVYCGALSEDPGTGRLTLTTPGGQTIPKTPAGTGDAGGTPLATPVFTEITPVKNCFKRPLPK